MVEYSPMEIVGWMSVSLAFHYDIYSSQIVKGIVVSRPEKLYSSPSRMESRYIEFLHRKSG